MVFYHNLNPIAFSIFTLDVYWYGLIFVAGFIIAYFFMQFLAKERGLNLTRSDIDDFFLWFILGIVLGARLFYVIAYNPGFYFSNPMHILFFWKGGLSFHGGLIGAVIAGLVFTRKKSVHFYDLADILVIPVAIALMLGRIGNFINGELWGRVTDVAWGVKFEGADGFRHPSQLYESFKNLVIFLILWNFRNKKFPRGALFWGFVTLYGLFRFVIEFFRQPDPQLGFVLGWMTMGQVLTAIMALTGFVFLYLIFKKHKINIHSLQ